MPGVVGVISKNREAAIKLLEQDDASQFVCEGHFPQREDEVRGVARLGSESVGGTDGEEQRLSAADLMRFQHLGQFFGSKLTAACIEENERGCGLGAIDKLQQRRFGRQFNPFGIAIVAESREVFPGEITNGR